MTLQSTLKTLADDSGLSIREIERRGELGKDALAKILRGDTASPSVEIVEKIAGALGTTAPEILDPDATLRRIPFARIHQSLRLNPRKRFDMVAIAELATSIAGMGLIQPLVVRPSGQPGRFEIVAGERRYRAIESLIAADDWPIDAKVPCVVRGLDDRGAALAALVENLQREDLPPLDEADAFNALTNEHAMSTEDIAAAIGKSRRHVQQRIALRDTHKTVRDALDDGVIGPACARAIGRADADRQPILVDAIRNGAMQPSEAAVVDANLRHARAQAPAETDPAETAPAEPAPAAPTHKPSTRGLYDAPRPRDASPPAIALDQRVVFQSAERREGFPLDLQLYDSDNDAYREYRLVGVNLIRRL